MSRYLANDYIAVEKKPNGVESNETLAIIIDASSGTISGNEGELSSSSSLGWSDGFSDEYENSLTIRLFEELTLMNNVLKGESTLPSHYDKDEYDQWMHKFPSLRCETPIKSPRCMFRHGNENPDMTNRIPRNGSDIITSQNHCEENKLAELNNYDISIDDVKNLKKSPRTWKHEETILHDGTILDTKKYLKICGLKTNNARKKQSARCVVTKKNVPLLNSPQECYSLPFIKIDHVSTRKLSSDFVNKKTWDIFPRSFDHEDHLVLPPITKTNNLRSISATSRQSCKTFSAFSTKSNLILKYADRK